MTRPRSIFYDPARKAGIYLVKDIPPGVLRSRFARTIKELTENSSYEELRFKKQLPHHQEATWAKNYMGWVAESEWERIVSKISTEKCFESFEEVNRWHDVRVWTYENAKPQLPHQVAGLSIEDWRRGQEEWSRRLREKVAASREKERLQVVCDIQELE